MSLPLPVECLPSPDCCEGAAVFYTQGETFLNAQTGFILSCPPGFSCDAGFYPVVITVRKGEIAYTPPTGPGPLRFTCCDGFEAVQTLPLNYTPAQFSAAAQAIVATAAQHLLLCKAAVYNAAHARKPPTFRFTSASAFSGCVDEAFSIVFDTTGGTDPVTFALNGGTLPPGTELNAEGNLFGTPTTAGYYPFSVTATDSAGHSATVPCSVTIEVCCNADLPDAWWSFDGADATPLDTVAAYPLTFQFNAVGTPAVAGHVADAFRFAAIDNQTCNYSTGQVPDLAYTSKGLELLFWLKFNTITHPAPAFICNFHLNFYLWVGAQFFFLQLSYDEDADPGFFNLRLKDTASATVLSLHVAHAPAIGTWRFLRLRYNQATGMLGFAIDNSALVETGPYTVTGAFTAGQLEVQSVAQAFAAMSVSLDELAIYLCPLTDDEASDLWNGGAGETCCPPAP